MRRTAACLVIAALLSRSLVAQADPGTPDSTKRHDSSRPANNEGALALAMAGAFTLFAVAPAAVLLFPSDQGPPEHPLPSRILIASLAGGGTGHDAPSTWTGAQWVELRQDHLYLSAEHLTVGGSDPVGFETVQGGYRARPSAHPHLEGGVTLGYRHAEGRAVQDAAVVSFPLIVGSSRAAMRLEPAYVFSPSGVHWSYRLSGEFYSLPRPLFAGIRFEARPMRQGGEYFGTMALLLGVRR
jgi:hypothetical protein